MRTLRTVCRTALPLGLFLLFLSGVFADAGAQAIDVRQACTPDAMRLCSAFIPDEAKITSCMMAKKRQLSAECRIAMAGGRHVGRHRAYRHHHRHS